MPHSAIWEPLPCDGAVEKPTPDAGPVILAIPIFKDMNEIHLFFYNLHGLQAFHCNNNNENID